MNCEILIPPIENLENGKLTVGRTFNLDCKTDPAGEQNVSLDMAKAKIELPKETQYALKLLKVESSAPGQVNLQVTSYQPNEWKLESVKFTDGTTTVDLNVPPFQVFSVLEKDQKPEMYGPVGPMKIAWPWIYILIFVVCILYAISATALLVFRQRQRRNLLKGLQEYDSALTPLQQFHSTTRKLQRDHAFFHTKQAQSPELKSVVDQIDKAVRLYMVRKFKIPALQWNKKLILKDYKQYHRAVFNEHGKILKQWFSEIEQLQSFVGNPEDVIQMQNQGRKLVEKLDAFKVGGNK